MKYLLALLLATVSAIAQTSIVSGTITAPDGTPWQTSVFFESKSTPMAVSPLRVYPNKKIEVIATNGAFATALFMGDYTVTVKGSPGVNGWPDSTFKISVPTTPGNYDIVTLVTNALTYTNKAPPAWFMSNLLTNKGDIAVYNGTNIIRLGVGTHGQALMVSSNTASGLVWSSAGGTGAQNLSDLLDVTLVGLAGGNVIAWDGSKWTNGPPQGGGVTGNYQPASANLTNWASIGTNAVVYPDQLASSNYVTAAITNGLAGTNLLQSLQTGSANLTNWANIGTNEVAYPDQVAAASNSAIARILGSNFVDRAALASSNYVTTNLVYSVEPGTNVTAVTNGNRVILSATGGGGGTNGTGYAFDVNTITVTNGTNVAVNTDVVATRGWVQSEGYYTSGNSLGIGNGNTLTFGTGSYFFPPLRIFGSLSAGEIGRTNDIYFGADSAGINYQLLMADSMLYATNGISLYQLGSPTASDYNRLVIKSSGTGFEIGSETGGTGIGGGAINFKTQGTNRMAIDAGGDIAVTGGLTALDIRCTRLFNVQGELSLKAPSAGRLHVRDTSGYSSIVLGRGGEVNSEFVTMQSAKNSLLIADSTGASPSAKFSPQMKTNWFGWTNYIETLAIGTVQTGKTVRDNVATNLVIMNLGTNTSGAMRLEYYIESYSGTTNFEANSGVVAINGVNHSGTITGTITNMVTAPATTNASPVTIIWTATATTTNLAAQLTVTHATCTNHTVFINVIRNYGRQGWSMQ